MGVRERILAIRLMDKLQVRPEYARTLGIEIQKDMVPFGTEKKKERSI